MWLVQHLNANGINESDKETILDAIEKTKEWQERLGGEFFRFQKYGAKKAREMKLTEKNIEQLIFEER